MYTAPIVYKNILSVIDRIKPGKVIKIYENFYADRKELYKEYSGIKKSFLYVIVNKLNAKCYVGSTRTRPAGREFKIILIWFTLRLKKVDLFLMLF